MKLSRNEKIALGIAGGIAVLGVLVWANKAAAAQAAALGGTASNSGGATSTGGTTSSGSTSSTTSSGITSSQLTATGATGYQSDQTTNQLETTPDTTVDNLGASVPTNPAISN